MPTLVPRLASPFLKGRWRGMAAAKGISKSSKVLSLQSASLTASRLPARAAMCPTGAHRPKGGAKGRLQIPSCLSLWERWHGEAMTERAAVGAAKFHPLSQLR